MTKVTFSEKQANTYHGGGMYVAVETNMGTVEGRLGEKWLSPLSGCFDFNWGGRQSPPARHCASKRPAWACTNGCKP